MLNHGAKKAAIQRLESAAKGYQEVADATKAAALGLHQLRHETAERLIPAVESYVNSLANSPKEFSKAIAEYRREYRRFSQVVESFQAEADRATVVSGGVAGAGALAGAGVAALGPATAMAIATTFGTASTGAAISALSGAAATNAALAWLGGGAIAAGGGGMAAGNALLALAGPVGIGIGVTALLGGAAWAHVSNGRIEERATKQAIEIERDIGPLQEARAQITSLDTLTRQHAAGVDEQLDWLRRNAPRNYRSFNREQREMLAALINNIRSLAELLAKQVS